MRLGKNSLVDITLRHDKKSDGAFAVKTTESARKPAELGDDCFYLVERFKEHEAVAKMDSYKQLVRMFTDQCIVEKDDNNGINVVIKASKDVSSDSLQNPSDPDAGYWQRLPDAGHGDVFRGQESTISKSWRNNWERIIPLFSYPLDIRKAIYTTNAIESLNM